MKNRFFVLLLALSLLLAACGAPDEAEISSEQEVSQGESSFVSEGSSKPWYEDESFENSDENSESSDNSENETSKDESSNDENSNGENSNDEEDEENGGNNGTEPEKADPELSINKNSYKPLNHSYVKAVWLSQFDLLPIYRNGDKQRNKENFTELMKTVLDNLKNDGYNTIFVQVRPNADSFYPSEFYPISYYVSGQYGVEDIYDPFEIIVTLAHERNLSVHAWLNPMRAMKTSQISGISDKYYIKKWYKEELGRYVIERNGQLYLNPAYESVRNLIANGAAEVCAKYNIDGVHIDDYFYPTTETSFDALSYAEYKQNGGTKTLAQYRYENVDKMVSLMYSTIKSVNKELLFGVSPEGNINNTYNNAYTDVYKWCSVDGFVDYICPQIYFGLEHQTHDFKKIFGVWNDIVKNEKIRVFVGMTLEKADKGVDNYAGSGKTEWADNKDVLRRCLEFLQTQPDCTGVSFFSYQFMYDSLTGVPDAETRTERDNLKPILNALGSQ